MATELRIVHIQPGPGENWCKPGYTVLEIDRDNPAHFCYPRTLHGDTREDLLRQILDHTARMTEAVKGPVIEYADLLAAHMAQQAKLNGHG